MTNKISSDEKKTFRDAMSDVKPLKTTQIETLPEEPKKEIPQNTVKIDIKRTRRRLSSHFHEEKKPLPPLSELPDIEGQTILSYANTGLQRKRIAQLRQGKIKIEATLDLHQHTIEEAIRATDRFLQRAQHNGLRTVCIIHGKGHFSAQGKPIIKNMLNRYLRNHPQVVAFHSAKPDQGGAGALYVLIKSA